MHFRTRSGLLPAIALALLGSAGCDINLPVDNSKDNAGVLAPTGVMSGSLTYIGPPPCIRKGRIEGMAVVLVFDAANPPPPDGLATTALNLATIPGDALFASYPRPASGPGSVNDQSSLCAPLDAPPVTATAKFTIPYLAGGHYQVRGFYSRQGRFNPLFDYANLPLAGDVGGGALVDPRTGKANFATIDIGVPGGETGTDLVIPPEGFVKDGVAVILGSTIPLNRPYFNIDAAGSLTYDYTAFDADPAQSKAADFKSYAQTLVKPAVRKHSKDLQGAFKMRQDHATTSQALLSCIGSTTCTPFDIAQASFPQMRFKYGFPGDSTKITADPYGADAWLAANAVPTTAFTGEVKRPYYAIDPFEFYKGVGGTPKIPTSGSFVLTRAVNPLDGTPDILHDNADLENLAQIANLYPLVLFAKLQDDGAGNVLQPPRAQTDPVVLVQTFTLRKDSMIATSASDLLQGDLSDPKATLNSTAATAAEVADGFSVLVRPAALCVYPDQPKGNFKGTVVSPFQLDPNPANVPTSGDPQATLVDPTRVLKYNPTHVSAVEFGCMPPGTYQVNIVFPASGQAWGIPNLMGHASYDNTYKQIEQAIFMAASGINTSTTFSQRPLLQSQALYVTDANGVVVNDKNGKPIAQVLVVDPSPRCMNTASGKQENIKCDPKASGACGKFLCVADAFDGNSYCDVNGNGVIDHTFDANNNPSGFSTVWLNNDVNEDVNHNGILDPGEDKNGNGKLDLRVPNVCMWNHATWAANPADQKN